MSISVGNNTSHINLRSYAEDSGENNNLPKNRDIDISLKGTSPSELDEALGSVKNFILNEKANSTNKEQQITDSLLDAIDTSAAELEDLKAWTVGGKEVIQPIINLMYDNLISDTGNTNRTEDLMQLLVFDFLLNVNEWSPGLMSGLTIFEKKYLGDITENFGSGLHAVYLGNEDHPPSKIVDWFLGGFFNILETRANVPDDSVTFKVMQFFKDNKNKEDLRNLAKKYSDDLDAVRGNSSLTQLDNSLTKSEDNERLSPTLKFFILAQGAKEGLISASHWSDVINGDIDTVKDLLNLNSKNDYDLAQWLVNQNIGWSLDNSGQLDFNKG
ncbi:hypothetical protein [Vibrio parahaemolyticus]|uniref:hypothetical protein n=1 Tax=Vibrio parahaemolyticus TaxID=670 RepID=UPI001F0ADE22|nr:hypothetical protein [Vibrio parahaemolyticus]